LKPENKDRLRRLLTYHVVPGTVGAAAVITMRSATAVSGDQIAIRTQDDEVMVGNARVVKADIAASNGVIHVIDSVMLPADK
jgi:uncharacterized surface protein with fasciclin (FAS1) repeats